MRSFLLALAEGGRSLLLIIFLICFVLFLNLFFGCATPAAMAVETWARNYAAIDALKDELRDAPKGSEKEARIKQAIDALKKSNVEIYEQVARTDDAEKKAAEFQAAAARWRWAVWGGSALLVALAAFGVFRMRK